MEDKKKDLQALSHTYYTRLKEAKDQATLEQIRVEFLGRSGSISQIMATLKDLSQEEKKIFGPLFNSLKREATAAFQEKVTLLVEEQKKREQHRSSAFDVTQYKPGVLRGSLHPYTHMTQKIEDLFISMGFEIAHGPEVETEEMNFEVLNIPADHPARDMQDTFWLTLPGMLLRTHTSTVQSRTMNNKKPPFAIVAPGRAYRHEATDASHDFMFQQCEGFVVDKGISMAHLLATTKAFLQGLFERDDIKLRMRPSFFPFVEPGVEIDMSCPFCSKGCSVCKKGTWIEICGAGLVHPHVLKAGGIDPTIYSGFAFGFGLTRLTMLKYGINDIRLLHSGKLRFLKQFP